ncbi:MAG TPA: hypothetical protein VGM18_00665 [Candidatus Sulfotelmatobacter sp.]|jgi:hypothetical protein
MFVSPTAPESASLLSSILDVVDKVTKILAVVIGGGWAYLNYLRGRTFRKRLELKISGKPIWCRGVLFLSGSAQIKNVGLSKFSIEQRGTAISVSDLIPVPAVKNPVDASEELVKVRSVYKNHGWIEPGETIEESFLLQLPEDELRAAVKLELRVVAAHIEWNANSIVELDSAKPVTAAGTVATRVRHSDFIHAAETKEILLPTQPRPAEFVQLTERPKVTEEIEKLKAKGILG